MTDGRPASPEIVRKGIRKYAAMEVAELFTVGQRGAIVGSLDKACGGKAGRYAVLFWLFPDKWESVAEVTSKNLTNSELYALWRWLHPYKDEHLDRWTFDQEAVTEVRWIMDEITKDKLHHQKNAKSQEKDAQSGLVTNDKELQG